MSTVRFRDASLDWRICIETGVAARNLNGENLRHLKQAADASFLLFTSENRWAVQISANYISTVVILYTSVLHAREVIGDRIIGGAVRRFYAGFTRLVVRRPTTDRRPPL